MLAKGLAKLIVTIGLTQILYTKEQRKPFQKPRIDTFHYLSNFTCVPFTTLSAPAHWISYCVLFKIF